MKKQIISILLLLIMATTLLCGCTQYAIISAKGEFESAKAGYYSFYVHWQRDYFKELLRNQGIDLTSNLDAYYTSTATVRQTIINSAKQEYLSFVIVTEKFSELGLSLTDAQIAELEDQYNNEWIQIYGEAGMANILKELDLTKDEFLNLLSLQAKSQAIIDYYYGANGITPVTEEDKKEYYNDNYHRFKYILLSTVDEKDKALSADEIAAKRTLANELNEKIKNGESIAPLIAQYSEDYVKITDSMTADEKASAEENNSKATTEGIICDNSGIFNQTLYTTYNIAVNSQIVSKLQTLKTGESAVVETDNAIWVIQEFDINESEDYYNKRADQIFSSLYTPDLSAKYTRWQSELDYTYDEDVMKELDPGNFTDLFSDIYKDETK